MSVAIYPGCSLNGSSREYMESIRAVFEFLNLDLNEVQDWNCCGATAAHSIDHTLSIALPSRILVQAGNDGYNDLLVPCAACYNRLKTVHTNLNSSETLRKEVGQILDKTVTTPHQIVNILDFITTHILPLLDGKELKPFGKKVACYYGCLLVRPKTISNEQLIEDPQGMDDIVKKLGSTTIDWSFKTECCGAGFSVSKTDTVARLSSDILEDAVSRGAEAIVVACPMCHSNLDMRRKEIEKYSGRKFDIPVLYISQVLGLALGISPKKLGLQRHFVPVKL